jgi:hypothetical protein
VSEKSNNARVIAEGFDVDKTLSSSIIKNKAGFSNPPMGEWN